MIKRIRKRDIPISLEIANLPGRKYNLVKPKDCKYCYWWEDKKGSCERDACYYILPEEAEKKEEKPKEITQGECNSCPYGKHSPCIGYCIEKIKREMGLKI